MVEASKEQGTLLAPDSGTFLGVRLCSNIERVDADAVIIGVPCATPYLARPAYGSANLSGPAAIRKGVSHLTARQDRYDWECGGTTLRERSHRVVDAGNLNVSFRDAEWNRRVIRESVESVVEQGAVPIVLGGEDSVPIPVLQGLSKLNNVTVLQLDAHVDWRDEVEGERWGLSSTMRRASELPFVKKIIQVGMRGPSSASPADIQDAKEWGVTFFPAELVHQQGIDAILDQLPPGGNVHINLDLDVLDPSIMPAVWVPTPGGLTYWHIVQLIRGVARRAKIKSFAVVEFCESKDPSGYHAMLAGRLVATAVGEVVGNAVAS